MLTGVVMTPVEPETEARPQVAAMMTKIVLTETTVEDTIGDRVSPDAETIPRLTVVTGLTTTVHRKMMTASRLVLPRNDCISNFRSLMVQDHGNPGGRTFRTVLLTITGRDVISLPF